MSKIIKFLGIPEYPIKGAGQEAMQITEFKNKVNLAISDLEKKKITNQEFKRIVDSLVFNLYKYFGIVK